MEGNERAGVWWRPDDPSRALSGIMTYSEDGGPKLRLIGGHFPHEDDASFTLYPVVLGHTERGEDVTLFLCQADRPSAKPGATYVQQVIWTERAFVGTHLREPNTMLFEAAHVEFSHLLNWDHQGRFEHMPTAHQPWEFGVTLTNPDAVTAETTRGTITLGFGHGSFHSLQRVEAFRNAYFSVRAKQEMTVEDWHYQFVYPLQNLVTLATDTANTVTGFEVLHKDVKLRGTQIPQPIKVFSADHHQRQFTEAHRFPLFTLDELPSDFSEMLERWLKLSAEMESVCSLYFGLLNSERVFATQTFLSMAQAAESYHRLRFGHPKYNLIDRLRALVSTRPRVVPSYVGPTEDFIEKVKVARNYYTHYPTNLAAKAARGEDLYYLAQALAVVVQFWLLHDLGFSEHRASQIIHKSARYNHLERSYEMSRRYHSQVEKARLRHDGGGSGREGGP